jgi:hypothetical protein
MKDRELIIDAMTWLGELVADFIGRKTGNTALETAIVCSCRDNYWFTPDNILQSFDALVTAMLNRRKLNEWISRYPFNDHCPQRIGLIMAGNIPLVNFHDLLSVLVSGDIAVVKPSSKDEHLIRTLCGILSAQYPLFNERIIFSDTISHDVQAVIATGSNNSSRYFRAEYRTIPSLIRNNRYSLAILDGNETASELDALADDIFRYFGLGCRNVSNMFIPKDYDWTMFFDSIARYSCVMNHEGYRDCYRYRKALSELSGDDYLDGGTIIIRRHRLTFSSVATINYEIYDDIDHINAFISSQRDDIQCTVSRLAVIKHSILFGQTQRPELTDYPDGIDTMKFLSVLS